MRSRSDFARLRAGSSFRGKFLSVKVARLSEAESPPSVAYAISKSVGSAPVRNRARRRIRSIVRNHPEAFRGGFGYLVQLRPGVDRIRFVDLGDELLGLLGQSSAADTL